VSDGYPFFRLPRHALLLTNLLLALPACELIQDVDDQGGNSTRGYFDIAPKGAVAEGGTLRLTLKDHETFGSGKAGISLRDPRSNAVQIARIASFDADGVIAIEGVKAGDAKLTFSARVDGDLREDHYDVRVARVKALQLAGCGPRAAVVRDTEIAVSYRFNPDHAQRTLGLGVYPFAVEPSHALWLDEARSNLSSFVFHVSLNAPDELLIASTLRDDPSSLRLEVIDPAEIDGVATTPAADPREGTIATLDLRPRSQGRVVCGRIRRVLRSLTPHTCLIGKDTADGQEIFETFEETATLQFVGGGACELELELDGVRLPFPFATVTVESAPEHGSGDGPDLDWD